MSIGLYPVLLIQQAITAILLPKFQRLVPVHP